MRIAVLGATGQIGRRVMTLCRDDGHEVIGVARRPDGPDCVAVDLSDPAQVAAALGSRDAVIATLGLPYDIQLWTQRWPVLTSAALAVAEASAARLVWLDNCYLYGLVDGPIRESQLVAPRSALGRARAASAAMLAQAAERGLPVAIGRAADFVGPGVDGTVLPWSGLVRAVRGRSAALLGWVGDPRTLHSYADANEVASGLLDLALAEADGVWHLPVLQPVTGVDLCNELGERFGKRIRPVGIPSAVVRMAGAVSPKARAAADMAYLTENDFLLDDGRFRDRFGGIRRAPADLLAQALALPSPATRL